MSKDRDDALKQARKETIAVLERRFAGDELELGEFEDRVDLARHATSAAELRLALQSGALQHAPAATTSTQAVPRRYEPVESESIRAIMGGAFRKGNWEPAEHVRIFALMGGVDLDFREASLLEGVTEVEVLALMGGVRIILPRDIDVEAQGSGFMGGFEHIVHRSGSPGAPLVRIRGLAVMGGVEIKIR